MDLSVIIPCYNEADNIANMRGQLEPVLAALAKTQTVELVLVDDGSRDDTWNELQRVFPAGGQFPAQVKLKQHSTNLGLGAAVRTGFASASGDILVTTDSDGTYRFETIPLLLSCLTAEMDMVTASPYHPDGEVANVPGYRLLLSKGSSFLYRVLLGGRIYTYTALFRAYRRQVAQQVPFEANGFLAGTEILVKAMLMGFRVAEYPAVLHARVVGVSKAKIFRTILAHLRFQGRLLLHRLGIRALVDGKLRTA